MRLLAKGVAALAALALLAGCGAGVSSSAADSSGKTVVTWWTLNQSAPSADDQINKLISDFEAANPTIKIERTSRAVDAHKDALRTAIGTSAAPDIYNYWAGPGLGGELVKANASADLADYYKQYNWESRFTSAALNPVKQYGGFQGVPWKLNGEGIYYNKTLFAKAGITELPTTIDELNGAAAKLKSAGITPIEFGGTVNWHVMRLLDTFLEGYCGSAKFDQLVSNKANWGQEDCVTKSFTNLAKWSKDYLNPGFIGINNDESSALFYTGRAAMALEGDWFNKNISDQKVNMDDFGVFPLPSGTGRLYGFEEAEYIGKDSPHKDAAAKFLDYLTSTKVQQQVLGTFGTQSVNKDVTPSTTANALGKSWDGIFKDAKGLYMNNDQNLSQSATTEYWRIQNLVATGGLDPAKAGSEFQKFLDSSN
ncbi:ABC transporter substrate-binding protein [Arthrobacter sp. MMS18-M83]|uniref:ABC transporter substrate-binding protein n=1 Tax=Arthrobacter sp. MMS18-M83 TaxID=2996261 RepID=UPI00227C3494|nr:extracellular solute-binding protein [Arthrobacter sp. MMS18-M83]WAH98537.1 extracellular solute-binding protein [Arthrobacter sp. MMS18-M83]